MPPIYLAPWPGTVGAFDPAAVGCLMGVFILAALLLCTSGFGGTSGFLGKGFDLALLGAGFLAAAPFSSSVNRAVAAALSSGGGTSPSGASGVEQTGTGAGQGAGAVLGTCGCASPVEIGGVPGVVGGLADGGFSFSTDGDFFFRNSGFGGRSGFLVSFGVVGGVLGFGDAREGMVFGGEDAFLAGQVAGVVVVFGSVFSGDLEGVCGLAADVGLAAAGLVFGGDGVFFDSQGALLAGVIFSGVAHFLSSAFAAATGQAAATAVSAAVSSDFATTGSGLADETKSLPSTFFGPVAFSSSDILLLGVRRFLLLLWLLLLLLGFCSCLALLSGCFFSCCFGFSARA